MKKFILLTFLTITLTSLMSNFAGAVTSCPTGQIWYQDECVNYIDLLVPRPGEGDATQPDELGVVGDLPELTSEAIFTSIIRTILGWSMLFALAALIATGIFYLYGRGKDEEIAKAKSIILYLLIGIAVMAASYGIVTGIAQFNFFDAQ